MIDPRSTGPLANTLRLTVLILPSISCYSYLLSRFLVIVASAPAMTGITAISHFTAYFLNPLSSRYFSCFSLSFLSNLWSARTVVFTGWLVRFFINITVWASWTYRTVTNYRKKFPKSGQYPISMWFSVFNIGQMSRVFTNGLGDRGSIPGRVIPKTQKWYLIAPCLTHYR